MPSSETVSFMPNGMRTAFIFGPKAANKAGRKTTDVSIAIDTPKVPPIPSEGAPVFSKKSRPKSPTATVSPEKKTALPAVAVVNALAKRISRPFANTTLYR
ncbi:MAG: hypothetical protein VYB27_08605 [Candidatus Thermoplasmatota archaeon]|nr:hypothetical protein [Candidatus Thermoplasmatota archaeon]